MPRKPPSSDQPTRTSHDVTQLTADPGDAAARAGDGSLDELRLDGYDVTGEVGRGGMGRVVRAHDGRLGREVAVKELLARGAGARARFELEARITARLQHPSIVPVYELVTPPIGHPYYAMKLVSGRTLRDAIAGAPSLADRLALLPHLLAVAQAIAYAHSQRVIHRDLKAANVILGEFGETIVIDWGLAKDLAAGDPEPARDPDDGDDRAVRDAATDARARGVTGDATALTAAGAVMGTPAYMAPEQALGDRVDERADVYALGVMTYQLVSGVLPFEGRTSAEIMARVIDGAARPLLEVAPQTPRDLAAIVGKAMARDAGDRYPSARELAAELARFAAGQQVGAHRYGARELLGRWVRRHKAAVVVGATALVASLALGAVAIARIVDARDRAETAQQLAERERDLAEHARAAQVARADDALIAGARLQVADDPRGALAQLAQLSPGSARWPAARVLASDAIARGVATPVAAIEGTAGGLAISDDGTLVARVGAATDSLVRQRPGAAPAITVVPRADVGDDGITAERDGGDVVIRTATTTARVAASPRARWLAVAPGGAAVAYVADHEVVLVDVVSGTRRSLGTLPTAPGIPIVAFTGHGAIIYARQMPQRVLLAWHLDGTPIALPADALELAASPDGAWLAIGTSDHRLLLRGADGKDRPIVASAVGGGFAAPRFDGRSRWLVWGERHTVHLLDLRTMHDELLAGHDGDARVFAFSPDGTWLASGGEDATVRLWDLRYLVAEGKPYAPAGPSGQPLVLRLDDRVAAIAFDPRGGQLATATIHGAIARWQLSALRETRVDGPAPHADDLSWWARITDDTLELVRTRDGLVRRLPGIAVHPGMMIDHPEPVPAFAAGAPVVVTTGPDAVIFWDHAHGTSRQVPLVGRIHMLAVSADGTSAAALLDDRVVALRPGADPRTLIDGLQPDDPSTITMGGDGAWLALDVWNAASRLIRIADRHTLTLGGHHAALSPDGRWGAAGGRTEASRCDLAAARCTPLADGTGVGFALAVGDDGRVAAGLEDGRVLTWPAGATTPIVLGRHHSLISGAALSLDETTLVTAGDGPEVRLWDLASGEGRILRGQLALPVAIAVDGARVRVADWRAIHELTDDLPRDEAGLRARLAALLHAP